MCRKKLDELMEMYGERKEENAMPRRRKCNA